MQKKHLDALDFVEKFFEDNKIRQVWITRRGDDNGWDYSVRVPGEISHNCGTEEVFMDIFTSIRRRFDPALRYKKTDDTEECPLDDLLG